MKAKFEINTYNYSIDPSKLIYGENSTGKKAVQYPKPCLDLNLIIFFATILDFFKHLEDIFSNLQ